MTLRSLFFGFCASLLVSVSASAAQEGMRLHSGYELPGDGLLPQVSAAPFASLESASMLAWSPPSSPTEITTELAGLAISLGYDPLRILQYVRTKVAYQPYWGSHKGAQGTFLDGAGNDMDQASLLIALLNAAGYSQTSYVRGKIVVPLSAASQHDLVRWFGTTSALAPVVIAAAGIPYDSPLVVAGLTSFDHIWVRVVIGGVSYDLDPSYKRTLLYAGINYRAISGYNRTQLLTDAGGTEGTNFVQGLSQAAVESRLGQYAQTLGNYVQITNPGLTFEEALGGSLPRVEVPLTLAAGAMRFSPSGVTTFTSIPAALRGTLRVQVGTEIDVTFPTDTLKALPLSLTFASGQANLWLAGELIATETSGSGLTVQGTLSTIHPNAPLSTTGNARTFLRSGTYDLAYAFYPNAKSNGRVDASDRRLGAYLAAGLPNTSREVLTESLHGLGVRWIKRNALSQQMTARVTNCFAQIDSVFGRVGQEDSYFVDMYAGFVNIFNASGSNTVAFAAHALLASAMEHGVIEERAPAQALSTVKCLVLANAAGQKVFRATPATFAGITSQLVNYTTNDLNFVASFANSNSATLIQENAALGEGNWNGFSFASFAANSASMMIRGGYKGGHYSLLGIMVGDTFYSYRSLMGEDFWKPAGVDRALSAEPVDLATGAYTMAVTDLALGEASSPRGLAFSRTYDSLRSGQSGPLGNGWRHSCEGKVLISTDLDAAFGFRQPSDAAQTVIGAVATADFVQAAFSAKEQLTGMLAANWTVNRIKNNAASVQLGEQRLTYLSLPNGSWNPPPGITTALTGSSGTFALSPRFGGSVTFDAQNRVSLWKDVDDNTQTYIYDSQQRLATVTDSQGRSLTFTYGNSTSPLLQSVSDGTGRAVTFSYEANNLTGINDVEGFNTTLVYDAQNRLTDWKDHQGNFMARNTYDIWNRVVLQLSQGDPNHEWAFLYSPGMTLEVNPLLNITTHEFDTKNRRIATVDPLGNRNDVAYNSQNQIVARRDGSGRLEFLSYDANRNLTSSTDNANKITTYTYDASLRLWTTTDPTNRVTEFGYDVENHLTSIKDSGNRTTTMAYRPDGRLQQITDPDNKTTTFNTYDQWANPTNITRADGTTTSAIFNARGDLTSSTDARSKTTTLAYDKRRLPTTRTDAAGKVSTWTYDSNAHPATSTNRNNKTTTSLFDNFGKLQSVSAPDTDNITFGYDRRDLRITTSDGLAHTTTTGFDAASRPVVVTDPLAIAVATKILDGAGRILTSKNGLNKTTTFGYDSVGRLSFTMDPMGRRVDHTYDFAGRPLTLKNRRNQTFTYAYGTDGLSTTFSYPSGRQTSILNRDPVGRPQTLQKPSGQQTALTYDGMGRTKTQADPVGTITWTYDAEGNPINVTQGSANIARTFDNLGRILTCTDTSGNTVAYTYDNEGNLATLTYPDNKTVTYTYDGSNRLKTVTDWAARLTTYTYDNAGRLTQVDRPNGTTCTYGYDNANRLTSTADSRGATSLWQSTLAYDAAYRLITSNAIPQTRTYAPPSATMTYDIDNRLTNYNGAPVTSDTDGNLLSAPLNGTLLGPLTWDARNRLTSAGGTTYTYDAENRRTTNTASAQTTTYTWSRGTLDRLLVKTNPDGSITRYVHGLGLIYEETTPPVGAATTQYYHYNWQGSTMALTDATGTITARLSYSPYGEVTIVSGTVTTPFRFNGQFGVMTEPNGLYCMMARFYSPIFRRFLSEDPAGFSGGINLFAYATGDPVNLIDPFGLGPVAITNSTLREALQDILGNGHSIFDVLQKIGGIDYDTRFKDQNKIYKYNGRLYHSSDINFIGVGAGFRKFGFLLPTSKAISFYWKLSKGGSKWDAMYFTEIGYNIQNDYGK